VAPQVAENELIHSDIVELVGLFSEQKVIKKN
jgi:hypothetical protein